MEIVGVREVVFWLIWCLCPELLVAYRAVQVCKCGVEGVKGV